MSPLPTHRPLLLELDLTELPVEAEGDDPLSRLRQRNRRRLRPTLRALHEAAEDPRVRGLVARIGGGLPWAPMQELRAGVEVFAASGKPTVAWAESLGEGPGSLSSYTLATAFGEIWLQPGGSLGPLGVGLETTFLRGALDKLGIEPQFERRHEYKNAVDRIAATELSPAHRESLDRIAASIFDRSLEEIAAARHLDLGTVRDLVDSGPLTAAEARAAGLLDRLGYRDEVLTSVRERTDEDAELLFADQWEPVRDVVKHVVRTVSERLPGARRGHVALVEARGAIVGGRSRRQVTGHQVGSDTVSAALRAAGQDDAVRAVVLKVDSPGGSAVASETIWREVVRVRDAGKPVVVSMGSTAASGGYYIAAGADVIVALPATLTGSIGVFGGKFVTEDLRARLGLSTGTVQRGEQVLMNTSTRRFTDAEQERLAALIDAIYDDFVDKVASGRSRPRDEIEPLARGRVWTGADAQEIGLVDELGGLRDAVRIARERGELPDDAPVVRAGQVPPLARLRPPRSSDDPRAFGALTSVPTLRDLAGAAGIFDGAALLLPSMRLV